MNPTKMTSRDFKEQDGCGKTYRVLLREALIAEDALDVFDWILRGCGFDGDYIAVYDENTYEATRGKHPKAKKEIVLPPKNLHANEHGTELASAQLADAKLLVAVGAGTVHDITRYICAERGFSSPVFQRRRAWTVSSPPRLR